jgi:hypothetical protein
MFHPLKDASQPMWHKPIFSARTLSGFTGLCALFCGYGEGFAKLNAIAPHDAS